MKGGLCLDSTDLENPFIQILCAGICVCIHVHGYILANQRFLSRKICVWYICCIFLRKMTRHLVRKLSLFYSIFLRLLFVCIIFFPFDCFLYLTLSLLIAHSMEFKRWAFWVSHSRARLLCIPMLQIPSSNLKRHA